MTDGRTGGQTNKHCTAQLDLVTITVGFTETFIQIEPLFVEMTRGQDFYSRTNKLMDKQTNGQYSAQELFMSITLMKFSFKSD